jgi:AcrR family transcriptional regulator
MARPKTFDKDRALEAAVNTFRKHGYEATSAEMLVRAMGIGRQSLYDTFGDKWQLYRMAVHHYSTVQTTAHIAALRGPTQALDGIKAMVDRVVQDAKSPCLGVGSTWEFGNERPDLEEIKEAHSRVLRAAIRDRVVEAQAAGDIAADLKPDDVAAFLITTFAGLRVAGRGGATAAGLQTLADLAIRALR